MVAAQAQLSYIISTASFPIAYIHFTTILIHTLHKSKSSSLIATYSSPFIIADNVDLLHFSGGSQQKNNNRHDE